ncbi:nitrate/nitrite transporter NarK [Nocardia tenerifensis]|uniref:Nitrate/nitrite transporter NarK n=1 Tax=Nocardia tenerifensis TaxID=228006 RepID=A0A318KDV4_9NOCA|nr:MFS transporter [Nocardia tenerifensis]PXX70959.1 nitrate/nitrite transporter NarK [Nocardia tenerifensis]
MAQHFSPPHALTRLWRRQLTHYPPPRQRFGYLMITIVSTVVLYYELYVQGAVATTIIAEFEVSFTQFVMIAVVGNLLGAFAALAAGLADRWGRANLITGGLFVTGSLVLFGLPAARGFGVYAALFVVLCVVEGMILVATPALIRDFSPQLGRASAMGFWTFGPVLGSLLVTNVATNTLHTHPDWQFQFRVCGTVGLIVAVVAALGLRELAPQLRDQLMVSLRDRALIEARAAGRAPARDGHWRQMLTADVLGSAVAISLYLIFYYVAVGFFVVYFATVFGYSEARANALANWYWISTAVALVATGFLSDRLRVRKPFMIVGALASALGIALFAMQATQTHTGYYRFAAVLVLIGVGSGLSYCAWMAGFTETVERHDPAGTATGLAVWGWINRIVVTIALTALTLVLPATSTLADKGHHLAELTSRYQSQLSTLAALTPDTEARLLAAPQDPAVVDAAVRELLARGLAADSTQANARLRRLTEDPVPQADRLFIETNGPAVAQATKDNPGQWQRWWWVCMIAQLAFVPLVFVMAGRWSPKRAREDALRHRARVDRELAALHLESPDLRATAETQGRQHR